MVALSRGETMLFLAAAVLFFIGFVLVDFENGANTSPISSLFILALALPSYTALLRWLGAARGFAVIAVFSLLPVFIEALAVVTGVPYGSFSYSPDLGYRLFGLVPWNVAFAYPPILFGALALGERIAGRETVPFVLAGAICAVAMDLVIDPAAVRAGFWSWDTAGWYYGIPLVNFAGWAITGALYAAIFREMADVGIRQTGIPASVAGSSILILGFWSGFLIKSGLLIPAGIGIVLLLLLVSLTIRPDALPIVKRKPSA